MDLVVRPHSPRERPRPIAPRTMENTSATVKMKRGLRCVRRTVSWQTWERWILRISPRKREERILYASPFRFSDNSPTAVYAARVFPPALVEPAGVKVRWSRTLRARDFRAIVLLGLRLDRSRSRCDALPNTFQSSSSRLSNAGNSGFEFFSILQLNLDMSKFNRTVDILFWKRTERKI